MTLAERFRTQQLANGYALVNGVEMHALFGDRFEIANPWFRSHVSVGHFVEVRIDSPRFSAHPDAPDNCVCPHCKEPATKPILCHEQPASLRPISPQPVPSRGWGEQFWVKIVERDAQYLAGEIDNPLYEARLNGLNHGDTICFRQEHILIVHPSHGRELVSRMSEEEAADFWRWVQEKIAEERS
jgi:hypothetical protein